MTVLFPDLSAVPTSDLIRRVLQPYCSRRAHLTNPDEPCQWCENDDKAAAELDRRFPVQPAAPASGWQPIESGPVDMPVLCWEPDLGVCVAWRFSCLDSVWHTDSRKVKPVMWMPLPEVPK